MVFWTIAEEIRSRHTLLLVWVYEDKESCPFEDKGPCTETDDIINLSEETLETKRLYDSIQWESAVLL